MRAPQNEAFGTAFKEVAASHGLEPEGLVRIPQLTRNGAVYDAEDRVLFGVRLVTALLSMKPRLAWASIRYRECGGSRLRGGAGVWSPAFT